MAGKVYLVGAGPGDPGLMTARSLELIASADAVLFDRLIPDNALDGARKDAILEYAGKGPSGDSVKQGGIEQRMLELAEQGLTVVRLKGGDPFVFGRGGEEAATLAARGIEFEIVPGVTAGVAASAYAGIPVTHRDHAAAVAFVTGHEDPNKPETSIDWPALAAFPGTLVFYMGVKNLPRISEQLIEAGRSADEPAAVIQQGTTSSQRTVTGRLVDLPELAVEAGIKPPALTVIGDVVSERERIAWFEQRPLFGRSVVVTRARAQSSVFSAKLRALGAEVIEAPSIEIVDRHPAEARVAIEEISNYDLLVFTSTNGVRTFFDQLAAAGRDVRALAPVEVAAVGGTTAKMLARRGVTADLVPPRAISASLFEQLKERGLDGRRVLLAVASGMAEWFPAALREAGADVTVLPMYDTHISKLDQATADRARKADFITFASESSVHFFMDNGGGRDAVGNAKLVTIGPVTSHALRDYDLEPTVEAEQHDIDGLLAALLKIA